MGARIKPSPVRQSRVAPQRSTREPSRRALLSPSACRCMCEGREAEKMRTKQLREETQTLVSSPVSPYWDLSVFPSGRTRRHTLKSLATDPAWGPPGNPVGASLAPRWWSDHPCVHRGSSIWLLSPEHIKKNFKRFKVRLKISF